jgi:HK97 family phage prohead protease
MADEAKITQDAGRATFTVPLGEIMFAAAGSPDAKGAPTVRGHAAVFNRLSHDLGGFRVKIAPGAFTKVLDSNPDVHLVIDHDTRYVLARTKNNTLELREDPYGLHMWARMVNTTYAKDLALLMEGGYVDQMSFACDIGSSEWTEDNDGNITRTIDEVAALYDVTICAQGAFPQTDAQLVASLKDAGADLAAAREAGLVARRDEQDPDLVAARGETGDDVAQHDAEGAAAVADDHQDRLAALQESIEARYSAARDPQV